jgi:uncharacterized membrane protein YfcA
VTALALAAALAATSFAAGLVGALTGLGGGVILVPLLTLAFGINLRYAVGASLLSVIATSSGAAAAYVREGYTNVRVGIVLEMATTVGAVAGAMLAGHVSTGAIAIIFGIVLLYSAYRTVRPEPEDPLADVPDVWAARLRLDSTYPTPEGPRHYAVRNVPAGFSLMALAGALSGLLGIGSGAVKVLAMNRAMRLPFKVSTTTSNFMIGVTAAASAGTYFRRGYIQPTLAWPVVLGVLAGALLGARMLAGLRVSALRVLFAVVIAALGIEMLIKGVTGAL